MQSPFQSFTFHREGSTNLDKEQGIMSKEKGTINDYHQKSLFMVEKATKVSMKHIMFTLAFVSHWSIPEDLARHSWSSRESSSLVASSQAILSLSTYKNYSSLTFFL